MVQAFVGKGTFYKAVHLDHPELLGTQTFLRMVASTKKQFLIMLSA